MINGLEYWYHIMSSWLCAGTLFFFGFMFLYVVIRLFNDFMLHKPERMVVPTSRDTLWK